MMATFVFIFYYATQLPRVKLTQKIQQRQHDQGVHAKLVAEHAFHTHAGHSADREVIDHGRAEIDASANWQVRPPSNRWKQFAKRDADQKYGTERHRYLARFGRII